MKVAFHLSEIRADEVRKALRNIENLREEKGEAEIHAVTNTSAVTLAREGGQFEEMITELIEEKDIVFKACANSIESTDMEEEDLIEGVEVVGSGVAELGELQDEGFGYIKP
ncbi:MAG: DsrE family protein [Candidatus Nanohaloarchaea archaeon]